MLKWGSKVCLVSGGARNKPEAGCWSCIRCCRTEWRLIYIYDRYSDENPNFGEYGRARLRQEDVLHIPGLGFDGLMDIGDFWRDVLYNRKMKMGGALVYEDAGRED